MRFTQLRIAGFKSFVEPAEFVIEPGLTGIVGPNGCGKSNLTEALRWVMGESSTRQMRAGAMDDVIFAGTTQRPPRNTAEVSLTLDNADRTAPAAFNDADTLEVSRRIEREGGSTYRVNGREARARDVQLLFADASSGARSPALVRQGQVAELIAAKPAARRRILEEAAGIAGLHARRHETELRLKAAEANLARAEDVLCELGARLDALRRQARQAGRYRDLSRDIRAAELLLHHHRVLEADAALAAAAREADAEAAAVAAATATQTAASTAQALAAHDIAALREREARAAAALQRLHAFRAELDGEEKRARERLAELERRAAQYEQDIAREHGLAADTEAALDRLAAEAAALEGDGAGEDPALLAEAQREAERRLADSEGALRTATEALADGRARREGTLRAEREGAARLGRLAAERERLRRDAADARARLADAGEAGLRAEAEEAGAALAAAEAALAEAERAARAARDAEGAVRRPLAEAAAAASRLETELATLRRLLGAAPGGRWRPVLDEITVAPGYEAALGAALGDDLDASSDLAAPLRWAGAAPSGGADPPLPDGAEPLAPHVRAPAALARRLAQVGLVAATAGPRVAGELRPGQRLVSREGRLWRWDGLVSDAGAPNAAARRLAEKNRIAELEDAALAARRRADAERARLDAAAAVAATAVAGEARAKGGERSARQAREAAEGALTQVRRQTAELAARGVALAEAVARVDAEHAEAETAVAAARTVSGALPELGRLEATLAEAQHAAAGVRAEAAAARAAVHAAEREAAARVRRLATLAQERARWAERREAAAAHVATLAGRLASARAEAASLDGMPGLVREKRLALLAELEAAETARREAADRLVEGEARLAAAGRAVRDAQDALAAARERRARSEARLESARERRAAVERAVREAFDMPPHRLPAEAGMAGRVEVPPAAELEARLDALRRERDRLGAVNLRAAEEADEVALRHDALEEDRTDLESAIRQLRTGIAGLNRDGREKLLAAFGIVDGHFRRLFATLFGGGTAELALIDSDDPLEAGLEIYACPPGKRAQSLGLLSGGEQALTATALIFAVFLTNPAPICVLDEVDAPLDDANVERYCDLLNEMTRQAATRFVVITHNPITMARMHRLFGVTMAERGVSQLVSVDLEAAERMVDAA